MSEEKEKKWRGPLVPRFNIVLVNHSEPVCCDCKCHDEKVTWSEIQDQKKGKYVRFTDYLNLYTHFIDCKAYSDSYHDRERALLRELETIRNYLRDVE